MPRKNLKVDEIVHEELETRKHRDESFNDVLKRMTGITPSSVEELTMYSTDHMHEAVEWIVRIFRDEARYNEFITEESDHHALNFDSKESGRTIIQLQFHDQSGEISEVVDIRHRNNRGELESLGYLAQLPGEVVGEFEFTNPKNGEELFIEGEFDISVHQVTEPLEQVEQRSYERWG